MAKSAGSIVTGASQMTQNVFRLQKKSKATANIVPFGIQILGTVSRTYDFRTRFNTVFYYENQNRDFVKFLAAVATYP